MRWSDWWSLDGVEWTDTSHAGSSRSSFTISRRVWCAAVQCAVVMSAQLTSDHQWRRLRPPYALYNIAAAAATAVSSQHSITSNPIKINKSRVNSPGAVEKLGRFCTDPSAGYIVSVFICIGCLTQEAFENVGPIRYCEPPLHCQSPCVASRTPAMAIAQAGGRCARQQQQRQRVTEGTAMAPWNGPNNTFRSSSNVWPIYDQAHPTTVHM